MLERVKAYEPSSAGPTQDQGPGELNEMAGVTPDGEPSLVRLAMDSRLRGGAAVIANA